METVGLTLGVRLGLTLGVKVGLTLGGKTGYEELSAEKWDRKENQCATEGDDDVSEEEPTSKEVDCKAKNSDSLNMACLDM